MLLTSSESLQVLRLRQCGLVLSRSERVDVVIALTCGNLAIERTPAQSLLDAVVGRLPLWAVRACYGYHMTAEPLAKRPDLCDMTVFSDCSGNTAQRRKKKTPGLSLWAALDGLHIIRALYSL